MTVPADNAHIPIAWKRNHIIFPLVIWSITAWGARGGRFWVVGLVAANRFVVP